MHGWSRERQTGPLATFGGWSGGFERGGSVAEASEGEFWGGKKKKETGRTFLDLGFLHLVVDGLLELSLVAVGESVDVDLRLPLIHPQCNFGIGMNRGLYDLSWYCRDGNDWGESF